MSLFINTDKVEAVILADGWHTVDVGSFFPRKVTGPITSIIAVREQTK